MIENIFKSAVIHQNKKNFSKAREIYEELLKQGVITRPLENYGLNNHLRITVGLEHENVKLINALKKVVA